MRSLPLRLRIKRFIEQRLRRSSDKPHADLEPFPPAPGGAVSQVGGLNPHDLEHLVPATRSIDERILMATRCRDADVLPKVQNAGGVIEEPDGTRVQIMHNGLKVVAGGYYGDWMQELIRLCRGHHEPQEEVLFATVLKHIPDDAAMIELGGYWSFYSLWFQSLSAKRRSIVVEADPGHLEIGRANARLNGCGPSFVNAFVGGRSAPPSPFQTEDSGTIDLALRLRPRPNGGAWHRIPGYSALRRAGGRACGAGELRPARSGRAARLADHIDPRASDLRRSTYPSTLSRRAAPVRRQHPGRT